MTGVLRDLPQSDRNRCVVATGAYNLLVGHPNLRRTLEKRLRQLGTDCIDVFLFLGVLNEKQFTEHVREEFLRFREEGKVRCIGLSTHHRALAGQLAEEGVETFLLEIVESDLGEHGVAEFGLFFLVYPPEAFGVEGAVEVPVAHLFGGLIAVMQNPVKILEIQPVEVGDDGIKNTL